MHDGVMKWKLSDGVVRIVRDGKGKLVLLAPQVLRHVALQGIGRMEAAEMRCGQLSDFGMHSELCEGSVDLAPRLEYCDRCGVDTGKSAAGLSRIAVETHNCIEVCLSILGYYCLLVSWFGPDGIPVGTRALDPEALCAWAMNGVRISAAGGSRQGLTYQRLRGFLLSLREVPLTTGSWRESVVVRENAFCRAKEFVVFIDQVPTEMGQAKLDAVFRTLHS